MSSAVAYRPRHAFVDLTGDDSDTSIDDIVDMARAVATADAAVPSSSSSSSSSSSAVAATTVVESGTSTSTAAEKIARLQVLGFAINDRSKKVTSTMVFANAIDDKEDVAAVPSSSSAAVIGSSSATVAESIEEAPKNVVGTYIPRIHSYESMR